ncbi:MAG: hypothetical protein KBG96_00870 [Paludibacter sp.]|nr:hypothetical protein [Paludibacter sp.]
MKTRNLIVILLSLVMFTNCYAQKPGKKDKKSKNAETEVVSTPENDVPETVEEAPVATEECLVNISLFNESAKNKQYADALGPWTKAYEECPGANRAIYSRGREILHWEISQAKDDATHQKVFDKLMGMYDNRIKYFGKDERYPTPWILGLKGMDYINFVKNDPLKKKAYAWLEKSIDGMGEASELEVIRLFIVTSNEIYKAEPAHAEKYIADYVKVNSLLDKIYSEMDTEGLTNVYQLKQEINNFVSNTKSINLFDNTKNEFKTTLLQKYSNVEFIKLNSKLIEDFFLNTDAKSCSNIECIEKKAQELINQLLRNPQIAKVDAVYSLKQGVDALFVQSGAANCETLDGIYKDKIAQNTTNEAYLNNIISFYKRIRCTSSEVYFQAAVAAHKIKPTAESANALAEMSYKAGEHSKAITYYDEATKLATEKMDKADYQYKIAQIYYTEMNNYPRSREYARNSLEFNPNNGSAYLLIGIMYAKSRSIYDDPVLSKTVYWVAVDKFVRAKQVDPSIADEANKLINTYSGHFPTKDDMFFQPQLKAGSSFFVGGWIGESTTCR